LLSEIAYGSLLTYSPRGLSEVSTRSRQVCYHVKNGDPATLQRATQLLVEHCARGEQLSDFVGPDVTLVPMPRSAPLVAGGLWPSEKISQHLLAAGLVGRIAPALARATAVPKSSHAQPGGRPGVSLHYESLTAQAMVGMGNNIVIVDDVVTKGSTALAAASRLAQILPQASIKLFALVRTKGLVPEIDRIIEPAVGIIQLFFDTGNRQP
jgi:hypothetical protein